MYIFSTPFTLLFFNLFLISLNKIEYNVTNLLTSSLLVHIHLIFISYN